MRRTPFLRLRPSSRAQLIRRTHSAPGGPAMTILQLPDQRRPRALVEDRSGVWLLLVSILAVVNSVGLSRLTEQPGQRPGCAGCRRSMPTRVAELEQQAAAIQEPARPSHPTRLRTVPARRWTNAWRRWSRPRRRRRPPVTSGAAGARGDIEARMPEPPRHPVRAPPSRRPSPKPEPPFNVVAWSCAAASASVGDGARDCRPVLDVWLLREGDAVGGVAFAWRSRHAAVFRVDDQAQRIALP